MSWNQSDGNYIKYPNQDRKIGYQKLPREDVTKIVERLNVNKSYNPNPAPPVKKDEKQLSQEDVTYLLARIADTERNLEKTPERQRIGADNYFNGWKAQEILHNMWGV